MKARSFRQLQSFWCLVVDTRPDFETGAWSTRNSRSFLHITTLPPPQPLSKNFCRMRTASSEEPDPHVAKLFG